MVTADDVGCLAVVDGGAREWRWTGRVVAISADGKFTGIRWRWLWLFTGVWWVSSACAYPLDDMPTYWNRLFSAVLGAKDDDA